MSYSPVPTNIPPDTKNPEQGPTSAEGGPTLYSIPPGYPYAPPYPQPYSHVPGPVRHERRKLGRRIFHFLVASAFLWLGLSHLIRGSFRTRHWISHRHHQTWVQEVGDYEYNLPEGVSVEECVQGDDWSSSEASSLAIQLADGDENTRPFDYEAETSFDLPLSSDTLFAVSRGRFLGGYVRVVTDSDQADDTATVNVVIRYNREELLSSTKACLLSRDDGEKGVGIFTPEWRRHGRFPRRDLLINYELTVVLPELSEDAQPLVIKNFETDIINSAHFIEDLSGKVFFDSISLRGSNGPIKAESINSTDVRLHTSNAPIYGKFNSTNTLILETSNGPITVDVGLESDNNGSTTVFKARTSNARIEAHTSLSSASGSGGSFNVTTRTSNGPLFVTFPESPVNSTLHLDASTSVSPATISLHPTYEGSFELRTSLAQSSVRERRDVEDPAGENRKRQVEIKRIGKGSAAGNVYWGNGERKNEGSVTVHSSISPVVLEL